MPRRSRFGGPDAVRRAQHAPAAYALLLGLYLGDGYISRSGRTHRLRLSLDSKYPGIIQETACAMENLMPGQHAWRKKRSQSACVDVSLYSNLWPALFPQHGAGRKHERPIRLVAWQAALLKDHHEEFLRGLLNSDGCRVVANDRGRPSVRYHFSNRSEDIKRLFCNSCVASSLLAGSLSAVGRSPS